MNVRKFTVNDKLSTMKWLAKRGLNTQVELCETGFIIPGVASCMLIKAENGTVIMDSLITNPHVSAETRDRALDCLFKHVKSQNYKRILGFTTSDTTLLRAVRHGFVAQPHILLTLGEA